MTLTFLKSWHPIPRSLNLGWCCDLLGPIDGGRNGVVPVLNMLKDILRIFSCVPILVLFPCVKVNFNVSANQRHPDPDILSNIIQGLSVRIFLDEINF